MIALFQSIQMLCPMAIIVLLVTGVVQPWMIIVLSVVVGVTDALSMPSFQSIVPSIVTRDQIGRGLALNSTQFNLSRILGPSIAGVLMSSSGATACFVVSAASYVPFIGVALWILPRWTPSPKTTEASRERRPKASIGNILREPHLRGGLLTVLATSTLCSPLVNQAAEGWRAFWDYDTHDCVRIDRTFKLSVVSGTHVSLRQSFTPPSQNIGGVTEAAVAH